MHRTSFRRIAIAFFCACASFAAHADEKLCPLLDWRDFQAIGIVQDTQQVEAGWREGETPKETPGSQLFSGMCAISVLSATGNAAVVLTFDKFKGKVTERQVSEWLKAADAQASAEEPAPVVVKLGEVTCEKGQYNFQVRQKDNTFVNAVEHYVACDKQLGIRHISLTITVPEDKKDVLPSAEATRALLEKSVSRVPGKAAASRKRA